MKTFITYLGGFIAFANLLWYAWKIWYRKVPAESPASWSMWTTLDGILLAATLAAHQPGWLPGAYTLGALFVTLALLKRGAWIWSTKETLCAIGAAISMGVWYRYGSTTALLAAITAMTLAGTPIWIDLWSNPRRATWPVWGFTVVACICTLAGSDWSLAGTATAWGGIAFNGSLLLVVLFKRPLTLEEVVLLNARLNARTVLRQAKQTDRWQKKFRL